MRIEESLIPWRICHNGARLSLAESSVIEYSYPLR